MQRRRSAPHTLEGNISAQKAKLESRLATIEPGPARDTIRKKIRQLDTASHLGDWLRSPGLKPPE